MRPLPAWSALALSAAAIVPALATAATSPIAAIHDDRLSGYYDDIDPAVRLAQLKSLGATVARVDLRWDRLAPTRP